MKTAALALVAGLCSTAGPAQPVPFDVGKAFVLKVGQTAQTRSGDWRIGFEGVTADSRCPKGVQCVWAGDAVVRIWLQRASGARELRDLHTAANAPRGPGAPSVRLLRVDPLPVAGREIAREDYTATLVLTEGATDDAEK